MKDVYGACRFPQDLRYRVTNKRFATPKEACIDLYGIFPNDAVCVPFTRLWRNLTHKQKEEIERKLGVNS